MKNVQEFLNSEMKRLGIKQGGAWEAVGFLKGAMEDQTLETAIQMSTDVYGYTKTMKALKLLSKEQEV